MDRLEQRLKDYYKYHEEYQPEAISGEFLERLKALESSPEAARRPRRRYVLPVAAAAALVLAIGGWFAWRHAAAPEPNQTPIAIQSGPASAAAESPVEPSEPTAKTHTGTKEAKPQKENVSEESVTLANPPAGPMSGGNTPNGSDGGAASTSNYRPHVLPGDSVTAKPDATLPVLPTDETPGKPNDETAVNQDEEASAGHSGETPAKPNDETTTEPAVDPPAKPDDGQPGTPDDPTPVEPDAPTLEPPDDQPDSPPDDLPEVDPPAVVKLESPFTAEFHREGNRDTVTLTLLSTGECVEVDVTGWEASSGHAAIAHEQPDSPGTPQNGTTGSWVAVAFYQPIFIQFTVGGDGTVHTEAYYLSDYLNHITQSIQGKENENET